MIRFTWLQFRIQTLAAAAGLTIVGVVLAITGPPLAQLYRTSIAACPAHGDCPAVSSAFLLSDRAFQIGLKILVVVIPGLLGLFWGAPLVARELETGTFRLSWTQSIGRTRWLAAKFALVGLAGMIVAGLLSLIATWWSSPLDRASMNPFGTFDERDLVPVGCAAFALALGITAGVLIRRTVPAMAGTLVVFTATRLAIRAWVRPNLIPPLHRTTFDDVISYSGSGSPPTHAPPRAWVVSEKIINGEGRVIGQNGIIGNGSMNIRGGPTGIHIPRVGSCPSLTEHPASGKLPSDAALTAQLQRCVEQLRIRDVVTYQPASRYWPFNGTSSPSTSHSLSSWPECPSGGSSIVFPDAPVETQRSLIEHLGQTHCHARQIRQPATQSSAPGPAEGRRWRGRVCQAIGTASTSDCKSDAAAYSRNGSDTS